VGPVELTVDARTFLASSRPRRPAAYGGEACVGGPGAASSRSFSCAPPCATPSLAPAVEVANLVRKSGPRHSETVCGRDSGVQPPARLDRALERLAVERHEAEGRRVATSPPV